MKKTAIMRIAGTKYLAEGIYRTELVPVSPADDLGGVIPGQFIGIYPNDRTALLPRPISICRYNPFGSGNGGSYTVVYRTVGKGTNELAGLSFGDSVRVIGMLGNGYDLDAFAGKRTLLLGGGIGIPPLLELAARIRAKNRELGEMQRKTSGKNQSEKLYCGRLTAALGYRNSELFLMEEFASSADEVIVATDDGSVGTHGTCIDAARAAGTGFDVIAACGPMPMLRGVKTFAAERNVPAYISLEERMACGVGVCLGCVVKTKEKDAHSNVNNARVCTEGPVFLAEDVDI